MGRTRTAALAGCRTRQSISRSGSDGTFFRAGFTRFYCWIVRGAQLGIFLLAGLSAFLLRFDFTIPVVERRQLIVGLCAWVLAKIIAFYMLGLDRGWWRYASVPDLLRLAAGNALGSALAGLCLLLFAPAGFPRSERRPTFRNWGISPSSRRPHRILDLKLPARVTLKQALDRTGSETLGTWISLSEASHHADIEALTSMVHHIQAFRGSVFLVWIRHRFLS